MEKPFTRIRLTSTFPGSNYFFSFICSVLIFSFDLNSKKKLKILNSVLRIKVPFLYAAVRCFNFKFATQGHTEKIYRSECTLHQYYETMVFRNVTKGLIRRYKGNPLRPNLAPTPLSCLPYPERTEWKAGGWSSTERLSSVSMWSSLS